MTDAPASAALAEHCRSLRAQVNAALTALVPAADPAALYDAVRYVLDGGGKRLRPLLVLLAAETFEGAVAQALPAALAVEVFHNFTLVHDDIMDHAATRRGRATVHVRWDESTAILCGDFLMALSYDLLAQSPPMSLQEALRCYHRMVTRLCEGQALDKQFETQAEVSVGEYLRMIDCKTGALLEASLELGGLVAGAPPAARQALAEAGHHLGRAFQIQDDLLDLVADDDRWGKRIGGDLVEGKKTFLLLRALEEAQGEERRWFARIVVEGGLDPAAVGEARARMEALGVLAEAGDAVACYSAEARRCLDTLPAGPGRTALCWLVDQMQARLH